MGRLVTNDPLPMEAEPAPTEPMADDDLIDDHPITLHWRVSDGGASE